MVVLRPCLPQWDSFYLLSVLSIKYYPVFSICFSLTLMRLRGSDSFFDFLRVHQVWLHQFCPPQQAKDIVFQDGIVNIFLILKNKTHVLGPFDPVLKNDAFAGSTPMRVAYIVFRNSSQCRKSLSKYSLYSTWQSSCLIKTTLLKIEFIIWTDIVMKIIITGEKNDCTIISLSHWRRNQC